jgi:hypothetical protein
VHVSPRPSDSGGARIERGFGRSEVATKSDLKGNYPAGPNTPRYIVTPWRVAASTVASQPAISRLFADRVDDAIFRPRVIGRQLVLVTDHLADAKARRLARLVLRFADGDCKDYSIAKFFALHEAGVPPERVRLVIVRDHRPSEDHMVVAVYDEGAWFILNNATMIVATDTEDATHYTPLFVLDKAGVRGY